MAGVVVGLEEALLLATTVAEAERLRRTVAAVEEADVRPLVAATAAVDRLI
jgi:hypothetical protein